MNLNYSLRCWFSRNRRFATKALRRRPFRTRLDLEPLELRVTPSTVQFTTGAESIDQSAGTFSIPVTLAGGPGRTVSTFASGLNDPFGMAFDHAGNLYVANGGDDTVSKVTPAGVVSNFASGFNGADCLVFDAAGNLYVSNEGGDTVSKVTPAGVVSTFASGFNVPTGLAFDASGNLYVANAGDNTVTRVLPGGIVGDFATGFNDPARLAFSAGNLYVANVGDNTVLKVSPGGIPNPFASGFNVPTGLAFDAAGNLYVANQGDNTVSEVTPAAVVSPFASGFSTPTGLAVDTAGNVYVSNEGANTVSKVSEGLSVPFTLGGTAVSGVNYSGVTASPLLFPNGQTTATITGTLLAKTGAAKTLTFTLGTPSGGSVGSPSANTLTITDLADTGTVAGVVFRDFNVNGQQDGGEPGLMGETLFLDLNNNNKLDAGEPTATSNASGAYSFTAVTAGTYSLCDDTLGGTIHSVPSKGSFSVTVTAGSNVNGGIFGEVLTSITVPLTLPPNTAFPSQGSSNADYVEAIYRAVLNRNGDPGGLASWAGNLNTGALTRLQVVQGIRNSPEHFGQEIDVFYQTLLGRSADPAGRASWVQQLQNGTREEQIAFDFLDSPEYLSKGDKFFVDAMYQSLLGRAFDAAGEASWFNALGDDSSGNPTHTATLTHAQVINDFLFSSESLDRLVEGYYEVFLQRQADPGGLNSWVTQLQQGLPFLTIGQEFIASDEFFDKAAANS